jgi:hypothetical protein
VTADIVIAQPADPVALALIFAQPPQHLLNHFHELLLLFVGHEAQKRLELELSPSEDSANRPVALGCKSERRRPLIQAAAAQHFVLAYEAINQPHSAGMRESNPPRERIDRHAGAFATDRHQRLRGGPVRAGTSQPVTDRDAQRAEQVRGVCMTRARNASRRPEPRASAYHGNAPARTCGAVSASTGDWITARGHVCLQRREANGGWVGEAGGASRGEGTFRRLRGGLVREVDVIAPIACTSSTSRRRGPRARRYAPSPASPPSLPSRR